MPKAKPSKEYTAFDTMMGDLLSVPKSVLDARMAEHRERSAQNPRKRGPKPKIKHDDAPASDVPETADETAS